MPRNSSTVSPKQQRIAQLAEQSPQMSFTSLAYLMDLDWLREAYRRTRKDGAVGIDGQSASDYERDLEANLQSLLDRAKSGRYQAPPVRRAHIPKPGSPTQTRPIGIPTLEDKLLQRAVAMLLEPIYEHDFHDSSYGFRPGRSAHQALDQLWQQLMDRHGGWIVEVDIQQFFDTLDHNHLRAFLRQRIRDGVVERLIGKWLKAGVLEEGKLFFPKAGSPQGGVISPMLANIYLHYVLDEWFEWEIKPRLKGAAYQVRYGDDFVVGCTGEDDARRLLAVLPKRFGKYGLKLHPDKTRLIPFLQPPKAVDGKSGGPGHQVRCFDLLGFTHYWGRSRKGRWVVKRKTSSERMSRALHRITQWCRYNRHRPLSEQQHLLSQKRRGHFAYYGITGNSPALSDFALRVLLIWRKWLLRRHRANARGRLRLTWLRTQYPLPSARAVHSVCPSVANP